ncbi:hypothetical protein CPJCM30710_20610 [Clostridium polyendosporum]|uniref:histidine kinase n=1 Tax=Clostridium polyendosporum TaxID=69208 RepID=A0A919S1E5_9CLOT|nr:PAS domain-containing sensor histidine kinase [Clostridium polyendosporum]GIM29395.1 hypothetical protein CPJCM30710_20610 [Clostridium polyendosporum]
MNISKLENRIAHISICIIVFFLVLLTFIGGKELQLTYTYFLSSITTQFILTLVLSLVCLIYFILSKEQYVLFITLDYIVLSGLKLGDMISLFSNTNVQIFPYLNNTINVSYSIVSMVIIYGCYKSKEVKEINYKKLCLITVFTFILGILIRYLDVKILVNFIYNQEIWRKILLGCINISICFIAILVLKQLLEKKEDIFLFTVILSYVFKILRYIYCFYSFGESGSLIFAADCFYIIYRILPLVGIVIVFIEKYNLVFSVFEETKKLENKLLKHYSVTEKTPNAIFIIDENGKVEYANPSLVALIEKCFNYKGIIGKKINELIVELDIAKMIPRIMVTVDRNKLWNDNIALTGIDKKKYYFNVFVMGIFNEEKKQYVVLMIDETENKSIAIKLQKSERKFRQITDSVHDLICKVDKEGRIEYCSPSYTKLFGGSNDYYQKVPWIHNVHDDDVEKVLNDIQQCIKERKTVTNECKIQQNKNNFIYVEYVIDPIEEKEKTGGAIISARDITVRKNAVKKLEKTEKTYKDIFNMCPDMIYLMEVNSLNILDVNPSMCELLGKSKELLLQKNASNVFNGFDFSEEQDILNYLEQGLTVIGHEISFNHCGEQRYLEVNYSPLIEGGKLAKILCLARDVTEKRKIIKLQHEHEISTKRLLEALQYDQLKTEFFANISHELRTPINVIFSALQVLDIYKPNTHIINMPYDKYSIVMKQNCYRLLRLINNLIDITKIDSGYFKLNYGMHDIVGIIEDITISVVTYAENKGIEVIFDTLVEELYIYCDPDKVERIILNLLSNAIKFTDNGGSITVFIDANETEVFISVKDTGRGIPKDKLDIIFERFRQVDKSLTREQEGSGIGLSLVKSLVELHGGKITVKSEINKGSEFIINMPFIEMKIDNVNQNFNEKQEANIERINIEFSDIYDIC